jgi:hypothetical protein
MNKEEHSIQSKVVRWASWNIKNYPDLDLLMAFPNERRGGTKLSRMKEISYFLEEGLKPGAPDLFLSVAKHGYHGFYLETKTPTGKLSKEQRRVSKLLVQQGYKYAMYRTAEKGIELISEYLGIEHANRKENE